MRNVIAICNQKGGVAKTTTCVSLGSCLAANGYQVLLIDCDPQSNLTIGLGFENRDFDNDHTRLYLDIFSRIENFVYETDVKNLYLIPARMELAVVEKELYGKENYELVLKNKLDNIREQYDFILCDCPPSLGTFTLNALSAADLAIIPVACDFYAARGLNQLLEVIDTVHRLTNKHLLYKILICLFDKRTRISEKIREQLMVNFSKSVLDTVIGIDCKIRECSIVGSPVNVYAPGTRASRQYFRLAEEIVSSESKILSTKYETIEPIAKDQNLTDKNKEREALISSI